MPILKDLLSGKRHKWSKKIVALPGMRSIDRYLRRRYTASEFVEPYPRGHYCSPLPDIEQILAESDRWRTREVGIDASIELNSDGQLDLLKQFQTYYTDFPYWTKSTSNYRFKLDQNMFGHADAFVLYSMLRHLTPSRVIEVGSGHTSALMLDTNERHLRDKTQFTFIEPVPDRLYSILRERDRKHAIVEDVAQKVPLETFQVLTRDDILFIDSSHVSKVGSDVNYLLFEVLPSLNPGVVVHLHDIFWPFEYPMRWIAKGKAWNEAYLIRAFLQYNRGFEVLLFNSYAGGRFETFMKSNMPHFLVDTGGSLWLRKL